MWMFHDNHFMRRRGHAHVPQEEQNDNDQEEDDDEEEFVNHRSHVGPNIPNTTTSRSTASYQEEESVEDVSSNLLENIELANHHQQQQQQPQQQHRSSEEFHDHPSSNTIDTSSNHDEEEGGRLHHDINNDNHDDNEDSLQEQLRFSYQRKTLLCNVFTVFVLFQMWFGWNDYTNANDISNEATTLDGIIATVLFSLIVIGINIQMRHIYHEQWQEQSSQVLSLISSSTMESSTTQPHDGRERTLQRQSQQQRQPRFLTWDDILHMSQSTQESQNGQTHHHIDLSMLSYQAQLAYAIMESQRHIIETGGYGNPDGPENKQGVSIETIQSWKTFLYNPNVGGTIDTGKNMTDTSTVLPTKPFEKEGPTCCICLCEYETNEELKEITPCGHWYHTDCIIGWVKHHTTCPLCQVELESK